ncbi:MAG: agmatinase family protein [Actinomycetota bacterium]|nr:agmatinase family protein [Actinomycetota bacterium]
MADDARGRQRPPGALRLERDDADWAVDGYPTFMGCPLTLTVDDLRAEQPDVVIAGTPWDGAMGSAPGARYGPRAIRLAEYTGRRGGDWTHPVVRIDPFDHLSVVDHGDVAVVHGAPEKTFARVRALVADVVGVGALPLLLGGDHSVTWPHVRGLTSVLGRGKVGVVHLDAHADTWPLADGEYTSHGSGMRQLIDGGDVAGEHFVQVGLRSSTDRETLAYMEARGMRSQWMAEIRRSGLEAALDRAVEEALAGPEHLFLSVDIDVCDPAHAPGTGAPEPGGLTSGELLEAVRRIAHEVPLAGMDIVEVSPPHDTGVNITAVLAHRVAYEALTGTAMRKAGGFAPGYADPRAAGGPPRRMS